jgi:hypothetical protein
MRQREASNPPQARGRITEALERLVQLYEATGRKDRAAEWQEKLDAARAAAPKSPPKS